MDKTVGVIGLGYVGLPLALTAVESGWNVVGFDKNALLIETLSSGQSHIDDVSNSRLAEGIKQGRFLPVDNAEALSDVDICIICVPTPVTTDHKPDLTYVESAARLVSKVLKPRFNSTKSGMPCFLLYPYLQHYLLFGTLIFRPSS